VIREVHSAGPRENLRSTEAALRLLTQAIAAHPVKIPTGSHGPSEDGFTSIPRPGEFSKLLPAHREPALRSNSRALSRACWEESDWPAESYKSASLFQRSTMEGFSRTDSCSNSIARG